MIQLAVVLLGITIMLVGIWAACSRATLSKTKRLQGPLAILIGNVLNFVGLVVVYWALIKMPSIQASRQFGEFAKETLGEALRSQLLP